MKLLREYIGWDSGRGRTQLSRMPRCERWIKEKQREEQIWLKQIWCGQQYPMLESSLVTG